MDHIVLLGLMGAGKTEIGRLLAERLGRKLVDGDDVLEARTSRTAREIADEQGIDVLHDLEIEIVLDALGRAEPCVIGPAASVIESATVRDALAGHTVIWLTASADFLARDAADKPHRPLVHDQDPRAVMEEQLAVRQPLATSIASLVLDVSSASEVELADRIVDRFSLA